LVGKVYLEHVFRRVTVTHYLEFKRKQVDPWRMFTLGSVGCVLGL
jgi:hypothetical protein